MENDNYWELKVVQFNRRYFSCPRRLWRWLGRLWRGAVAWWVEREDDDELRH